jgi:hypothetical protein
VAGRLAAPSPSNAFLDQANLQPGDSWPDEIAEALAACQTFLPIITGK